MGKDQIDLEEYEDIWPYEQEYQAWMEGIERDFYQEMQFVAEKQQ
jgi:hypothetical protein